MKSNILKLSLITLGFAAIGFNSTAQNNQEPNYEKRFAKFDTDKDGKLSLEEFKNVKRKKEIPAKALEKNFAKMDANGDGAVTLEEFKANMMKKAGN